MPYMLPLLKADAETYMRVAGFKWDYVIEGRNGYYPSRSQEEPYLLFLTQFGPIRLGGRKRVLQAEWEWTGLRKRIFEEENVTSEETFFHAWSVPKFIDYLSLLREALASQSEEEIHANHYRRGAYCYRPVHPVGTDRNADRS